MLIAPSAGLGAVGRLTGRTQAGIGPMAGLSEASACVASRPDAAASAIQNCRMPPPSVSVAVNSGS